MIYVLLSVIVLVALVRIFPALAPGVGYGIAAKAATTLPIEGVADCKKRATETLLALRLKIVSESSNKVVGRTGMNWRSWGEDIAIEWDDRSVTATSRCVFPFQILDWGKNRINVKQFVSRWENTMQGATA